MIRVGLVGFGYIGRSVYRALVDDSSHYEVAFVYNRSPSHLHEIPRELVTSDLSEAHRFSPNLIIELAHPEISLRFGASFLKVCDYMPLSVTALADENTFSALETIAKASGHRLFLPHGALPGLDSLVERKAAWTEVTITFRKHPDHIDFSRAGHFNGHSGAATVVFDGPVKEAARRFPRNVNTMVTCAIASLGVSRTRGILIADPTLDKAVLELDARGDDGSSLQIRREQPMVGVSGTEMVLSTMRSIRQAASCYDAVDFL